MWFHNNKGGGYAALGEQERSSEQHMGFKDFLVRVDRVIQVDHGPVSSKTQLFLTKYPSRHNLF